MSWIAAGTTAVGLGSQIFGAVKSGKANRANYRLLEDAKEDNEAFRNNTVNRDFMDTNAAKGVFTRLKKSLQDANKTVESKAAVNGSTAEAEIAAKSKNQEGFNDTTAKIAEGATAYQQQNEQAYRNEKNRLLGQEMNLNQQKAQNAANLASNAASTVSAAANIPGGGAGGAVATNQFGRTAFQEGTLKQMGDSAMASLKEKTNASIANMGLNRTDVSAIPEPDPFRQKLV